MKYKNLVITQNAKLFQSIRPILICADLDVSQATTYQKALELFSCFHYVLVVADLSFPDIDGIKLIHSLRRLAQVPILAFTSKFTTEEEIQVLFAGADDYLDCGVVLDSERCLAHITAITRRYLWKDRPERAAVLIPGNGLKINLKRRRAYFYGENLRLTPKQFIVLQILVERMGEVVTKEELCEAAWETDHDVYADDALKYHVREIRRKLGQHGMENQIETVWAWDTSFLWKKTVKGCERLKFCWTVNKKTSAPFTDFPFSAILKTEKEWRYGDGRQADLCRILPAV